MTFLDEKASRKVDSLGRISIPKSLRDRFEINPNDEMDFSVCYDDDRVYICMRKHVDVSKAEILASELISLGVKKLPEELEKMLGEN